jgi:hypothetical protein
MKAKHKIALIIGIFFLFFMSAIFWLGGYNFDERGPVAVMLVIWTLLLSLAIPAAIIFVADD